MSDRPNLLSFLEGIGSGILILIMLCGFIGQYFIFRTHTGDFEIATKRRLEILDKEYKVLEGRLDTAAIAESALSTDIANLKRQIDRLEVQIDKVLEGLQR